MEFFVVFLTQHYLDHKNDMGEKPFIFNFLIKYNETLAVGAFWDLIN